ncbi:clathrin light chain [Tuber brumale]|nr:clathrin light chain [Tuber brumale]
MASRFPSIEEFDEGQTSATTGGETPLDLGHGGTSGMDFSERERLALGEDAAFFANPADSDLLGGGSDAQEKFQQDSYEGTYFPALDNPKKVYLLILEFPEQSIGPGGVITGTSEPYLPNQNTYSGISMQPEEEEPEVIKQWRERQTLEIQRRDELSETRKRETIEKAQRAVDDFYENYNSKRDKAIEVTRAEAQEFLDSRENTTSGGTSWERIAKLVDLTEKGARGGKSDKTRFREMLLSLKKDEKAPGASGF